MLVEKLSTFQINTTVIILDFALIHVIIYSFNNSWNIQIIQHYYMLSVHKLISCSVQLSLEACSIIKNCYNNQDIKKYMKDVNDPVTDADFKVQTMLTKGLKHRFPDLRIIGQENKQYEGNIQFDYSTIKQDFLPLSIKINQQFPLKDVCIWIDPIDCTKGFINGRIQDVTVLIGLSYKNSAMIGIVGIPFQKINQQQIYKPTVIFGSVASKMAYSYQEGQYIKLQIPPFNAQKQIIVVTSNTRPNKTQNMFIENIKAKNLLMGGSGKKIMMVAQNQADIMVYLDAYTSKWDTCAPQAIITAMGGYLVTPKNTSIVYDPNNQDTRNYDGIIGTLHQNLLELALKNSKVQ